MMYEGSERRSTESDIKQLASQLQSLNSDVTEIKMAMKDLAAAITKLALVEERQSNANQAQERAFAAIERIEQRLMALEKQAPLNSQAQRWIERGVIATVAAVLVFAWGKLTGKG